MESIRTAMETACAHLAEHPDAAISTDAAATAVGEGGLRFRVEGPKGAVTTDMAASVGGGASAPTPAWLMRAALASCDATLIAMEAARDGVELTDLKVTVDSESDDRGILGLDPAVPAGALSVRVVADVRGAGVTAAVKEDLISWAVEHCPVLDTVRRAIPIEVVTADA